MSDEAFRYHPLGPFPLKGGRTVKKLSRLGALCALLSALCAFVGMAEGPASNMAGATVEAPPASAEPAPSEAPSPDGPAGFVEADAPYAGIWTPFEDGFMLYLPRAWSSVEVSEAQAAAGLFYQTGDENGTAGVAVGYMPAGDLDTLDDLALDFERSGFSDVICLNLNGMPAIGFDRPEDNYSGVAFYHPVYPDYVLYVYVTPLCRRGKGQTGESILMSLTPTRLSRDGKNS